MSYSFNKRRRTGGTVVLSRSLLCGASLAVLVALGMPGTANAQDSDKYWDANGASPGSGGTGNWDTSSPIWSDSNSDVLGPYETWDNSALDNAIFGLTAAGTTTTAGTISLTSPITVHNMTFQSVNGWTLSGNTLTLAGTAPTLTVNADTTINSVLAGTVGFTKLGPRTLTLTGANTFSGGITLGGGVLRASTDASLGALSNNIAVTANSTLQIDSGATNRTVDIGAGTTLTIQGSGTGSALYTGAGNLSVGTAGSIRLTNDASTYTGTTRFNGCNGVCTTYFSSIGNVGEASSLGAPTDAVSGTILFAQNSQYSDNVIYIGDGDSSNRNWNLVGAAAIIRNQGTGALSITGDVTTNGGAGFSAENADIQLLGTLSGGNYSFSGNAGRTITLGGANDYTGSTAISAITLLAPVLADMGVNSSLGAGTTAIALSSNGTLSYTGSGASSDRPWSVDNTSGGISNDGTGALVLSGDVALAAATTDFTLGGSFAGANMFSGVIFGAGDVIGTGSGTWTLGGANSFTGGLTVDSGTLRAGSASAFGNASGVTVNGGTLDLNNFDFTAPVLHGAGGAIALGTSGVLTVSGQAASSYAGSITGGGALVKSGTGTLTLTGANSYTGGTTVNGGTLALDFSGAGGPAGNLLASGSTLDMSGGTFEIIGAAGEANSQSLGTTNITAGSNTLGAASGAGGSAILALGTINHSGGLANFVLPASGSITTINADGLLGGWATVNGTDYAKVLGGLIVAFTDTDYTTKDDAGTWLDGEIISDADGNAQSFFGTVASSIDIGGLKYSEVGGSTVTIAAGQQLAVDGTILVAPSVGAANQTITGSGTVTGAPGGGTLGIQQNGGGTFTIASTIVDNGGSTGFVKGGSGTAQLTGANSYTDATTLSGGQLNITSLADGGVASSIGASTADSSNLVLESGTLAYIGGTDAVTDRGFTLVDGGAGSPAISVGSGRSIEFSGQVTSPDDAGLTKTGWGTLVLSNASNDYVGVTMISGSGGGGNSTLSVGTLADGGLASGIGAATSDSANLVLDTGGVLQYTGGSIAIDRGFTLSNGGGIDVAQAATTLTISGTAAGAGPFVKTGAGTLVLSGTNTYTGGGGTHVAEGTLRAGSTQAFGGGAGGVNAGGLTVDAGAVVDLAGNSNYVGGLFGAGSVLLGNATLNINSTGNFSGNISGTGGISVTRYGQTMVGCNNSYTGATSITSTLNVDCIANGGQASGIGASSSDAANLVINGTLTYTGGTVTTDRGFTTGAGQIIVNDPAAVLTFTGATTGTSFTKTGAGTLVLAGASTRNNNTQVNGGTLRAGTVNAFGSAGLGLGNVAGAVLDLAGFDTTATFLNGGGALGGNVTLGGATLTLSGGSAAFAGAITGAGNLTKGAGGTQTLTGCDSSYTGITTVAGGVLAVGCLRDGAANSAIGASSSDAANLVVNGGTFRYVGAGDSTDRQFTLGTSGGTLDASGTGAVAFTGTAAITLAGTGNRSLTLRGTNTDDNILAALITNPGTGVTSLIKTDAGTWRLTNQASSYTGATTISGGVLSVDKLANGGVASSIGMSTNAAASLVIGSGGTLRYTGAGDSTDRRFTLGVGTTAIESSGSGAVVFTNTGAVSYAGNGARVVSLGGTNNGDNIMGAAIGDQSGAVLTSLAKNGAGTWILTGANSYTGVTNINTGTLTLGNGGTSGSIASATINNFGLLGFNRSDTLTYAGVISQTGAVEQIGTGTTILTGDSSYTGGTTISAGTLQLGNGGTTGSVVDPIIDNGTLAFDHSNVVTYSGVISGTGSVRQIGTGTLVLSGTNSYAGGTTISGGTVQVSSDANLGDAAGTITFDRGTLSITAPFTSDRDVIMTGAGTVTNSATATWTLAGDITGAGPFTKAGAGTMVVVGNAAQTGGTTIAAGTLAIGNGGTTGTLSGDVVDNGTLSFDRSDSYTYAGSISGSGVLSIGGGVISLSADSNYGGGTNVTGDSELRIAAGNSVTSGGAAIINRGTLTVAGAGSTYTAGTINAVSPSGDAVINVENGGTVRATAGGLAIRGSGSPSLASLNVSGAGSLVDVAGGLTAATSTISTASFTISDGGTLRTSGASMIGFATGNTTPSAFTITGTGANWTSAGTLTMYDGSLSVLDGGAASFTSATIGGAPQAADVLASGADSDFTTSGDLVVGSGTGTGIITLADAAHLTVGGTFTLADTAGATGVLNIGGAEGQGAKAAGFYDAPALTFGAGTGRLNFNHTETNYAFATAMSGAGTINQIAGVTNLTGDSSAFTGTTNVSGGTLRVNRTLGGAASVTNVLNGGTLGGAGTIGGNVAIADGGVLAPGNSPGTLTINGNLALSAGSVLNFEFGQAGVAGGPLNDLVNVGGNLTLDGAIDVTESAGGTFGPGIYRVFNYGGTLIDNGLAVGALPGGQTAQVQTSVAGQVNLVNTTGLAFSFWDGAAGPKGDNIINGGDGTWHLAGADANWTDAAGSANDAWSDGTTAIFAGAAGTVTVDDGSGNVTVQGMQFATNAYRIVGDDVTLLGPEAAIQVGDGSTAGATYVATIDANLTGASTLVKTDLGELVLTGANTYTGGTVIDGGSIEIASDLNLGAAAGGISFNGGALAITASMSTDRDVALDGAGTIAAVAGANVTLGGDITGAGSLTIATGAGTSFILTGDATHGGGTTLNGTGSLVIGNGGTSGSIAGDVVDNGTLTFNRSDAYTYAGSITGIGNVSVIGNGVTTLTGTSNYAGTTTINNVGSGLRVAGGGVVTSGGATTLGRTTLAVDGVNSVFSTTSLSSNTIGAGMTAVTVTDGGTFRTTAGDFSLRAAGGSIQVNVDGANSLADVSGGIFGSAATNAPFAMTIGAGGTLRTGGASEIGSATSATNPIAVAITGAGSNWTSTGALLMTQGSFTVDQGAAASFSDAVFGSSMGVGASATLTVSDTASSFATTGDLTIGSGTGTGVLTLSNGGQVTVGGNFVLADGAIATGILNIGGAEGAAAEATGLFDAATLNLGSATSRINFNHSDPGYVFATVIGGAGAVNQTAGTTILTGANSYGGATNVDGGTLLVNGDQTAATGLTSVNGGGTIGGIGTIGGDVSVAGGATLAPGDAAGPGTLTINGNLALSNGTALDYDFGQSNVVAGPLNDLTRVGGDLTLDGTINLTVSPGGSFDVGLYRVVNYDGTLNDQGLALGTMPAGSVVGVQTSVANQVNLVNSAGATVNFWDGGDPANKLDGQVNGGNGVWQNGAGNDNWADITGTLNNSYQDSSFAIFAAAPGTVAVDAGLGAVTASGMQFASDGYVVTGDGIGLTGSQAVIRVGDGTADGAGYTATIASAITGAGDLAKTDLGTLVLTGANSLAGDAYVAAGELRLADGGTLDNVGAYIGRDAGSHGTVTVTGHDAGGNASTWTTTGDFMIGSDGFGTLNIADGGRVVSNSGSVGAGSGGGETLVAGGASWASAGRISVGLFGTGSLRIEGGATVTSNDGVIGDGAQGDAVVTGAGSTWTNAAQLSVGSYADGSLRIEDGANVTGNQGYIGAGAGANGSITVTGAGSSWLVNMYSITVGNSGNGVLSIEDGGLVHAEGGVSLAAQTGSSGTVTLLGTPADRAVLETSWISAGAGNASFSIDGGLLRATQDADDFFVGFGANAIAIGANGAVIDTGDHDIGIAPNLVGSGDLTKQGTATLTLTGVNSYAGATDVTAGTLFVNGDQTAATGLTTVGSGATIGGTGIMGGDVTLADGATLAPGAGGVGTLTINGNLGLAAGSVLDYEFGQANVSGGALNDLVNVGGNLTLNGTINVTEPAGGTFGPGIYRVFNYGGTLTDNGLTLGNMPAGSTVSVQTAVAGQVNLVNTANLTLSFWDGDAGPKNSGLVDGGNGTWRVAGGNNDWTGADGTVNGDYAQDSFAIFTGAAGTVAIDNGNGDVSASGMQFASDGYVVTGEPLTLTGAQAIVQVGDGSAAGADYTATIAAAITGTSQLVKTDAGTLVLTGANSYTGGTRIDGGTLRIANDANLGDAAGGLSFGGGILNTTADLASTRDVAFAGAGTFLIDGGTTLTLTGAASGAGSLIKSGDGTLVLGGNGSYTGGTQVGQGTLLVNGDYAAATGTTMIGSGAILGGTGAIGGSVTLADGAILSPGAGGAGTLTIGGNLTLADGALLSYDLGQAGAAGGALNDLVNVGGDLTLDGTIDVAETAGGTFGPGIYRIINYDGTLTDDGLTLGGLPAGSNVTVQTSVAEQVNLIDANGAALNFWDGAAGPKNDGTINGGDGVWQGNAGNNNWTDADGIANGGYADGAFAIFGGAGGTVTVDNSLGQVTSGGMQFAADGYTVGGQSIALTDPQATIRVGDGSTAGAGFTATISSVLSGASQLVKTDAGTLVLGGENTFTGGVAINGGTVRIDSDGNLGAASGGVSLANGTLATTADISSGRDVTMAGAGTISTADSTTFTLSGQLAGAGALTKAGAGTLLLTGDSGAYTGATTISGGTLAVTGKIGGPVAVNGGARLEGTGGVGGVTNAGTVAPGREGFGTLTTTGYTGAGGTLEIETALGGDASPTDLLTVDGATAGTTVIDVANRGGLGAQTVEGIKIVDVTGASNGVFALRGDYVFEGDQAVIAGAYGYRLYKGEVSTPADGDWYLRSTLLDPGQPTGPQAPIYQPGVPVYEAYGQTLLALTDLGTLQQRLGDRQQIETLSGRPSGIWGRMESRYARPDAAFSTTGADVDTNSWKAELGADQVLTERGDGSSLVVGAIGSYGEANAAVGSMFGNGTIKTRAYSLGATLTWFGAQGFYADGRAQVTWFDSKLRSNVLGTLADSNKGTGQTYSVELGKRTPVAGALSVTPQIQMVYSTVGFDTFTDPNGATVSSRLGDSLKSRWGLSIDRQDARSHFYVVGNLSYEWLDGKVTDVSGTPIARSNDRLWGELGVGGSVLLSDRVTLYTEASANTALHDLGNSYTLKGTVGLRLAF